MKQGPVRNSAESPNADTPTISRLVLAALLTFAAFCAVVVTESFVPAAFGFGVMRVGFAGAVAGLSWRRGDELWHPPAVAGVGASAGALVLASSLPYLDLGELMLQAVLAALLSLGVAVAASRGFAKAAAAGALLFVCVAFLWQVGIVPGTPRDLTAGMRQMRAADPLPEQYQFDGELYARAVALMKAGVPYYEAFAQAFEEDGRLDGPPPGVLNYRQRWLSEIWTLVPGSGRLAPWRTLVGLTLLVMVSGYALARRYVEPSAALLVPIWLAAYFSFPLLTQWTAFAEFFAGGMAILALLAVSRQRWFTGAVLLTVAVAFRELMLMLVPVYIIAWALYSRRRDELAALAVAVVAPVAVLAYHFTTAPGSAVSGGSMATWLQGAGLSRLREALLFSTDLMALRTTLV